MTVQQLCVWVSVAAHLVDAGPQRTQGGLLCERHWVEQRVDAVHDGDVELGAALGQLNVHVSFVGRGRRAMAQLAGDMVRTLYAVYHEGLAFDLQDYELLEFIIIDSLDLTFFE